MKTGIDSSLHSRLPPQNIRTRQLYFELLLSEALRTACQFPHQTHQSHQQMKVWPSGDRAIKIVTPTATDHCWRKIMACYGMAPSNKLRYFYMCQHQVHTWYLSFFYTSTYFQLKIRHQKLINCDTADFATKQRNFNYLWCGVVWSSVEWSRVVWCGVLELTKVDFTFSCRYIHSFEI